MITATPAGDAAVLFDTDEPPAWLAAAITAAELPGVREVVPGARTVLVITEPGSVRLDELTATVSSLPVIEPEVKQTRLVEIPVSYDGPDLAEVAELAGMTVHEVISRHSDGLYTVGWLGFAPGFGYLTGLDPRLHGVPRLAMPRLAVPAGSVAIAAGLAAVYPSVSPGGWRLIGRTTVRTWDVDREPAALFSPGTKVRFTAERPSYTGLVHDQPARTDPEPQSPTEPTRPRAERHPTPALPGASHTPAPIDPAPTGVRRCFEVIRPGPFATVQDLGRVGTASMGVPPSGAADRASLIAANRLAGNPDRAAGIELTLGRATLRCLGGLRLAATGAPAVVTLAARPDEAELVIEFGTSFEVPDGGVVRIGAPAAGLRTYVAVTGGLATPAVLGSRSVDVLSGLGAGALRAGDVLTVGLDRPLDSTVPPAGLDRPLDLAFPVAGTAIPARGDVARLRVIGGPRLGWFEPGALELLCGSIYSLSPASNRTGLRLSGPPLPRLSGAELPSEGMVTGSIEVPPDGQPILLLADHPTVGGYPVIAVVISADVGLAAQLRPGDKISFAS